MPALIYNFVSCVFLATVLECADVLKYSDKCPKISPIQEINGPIDGHWYLYASNKEVPFSCVNYEATQVNANTALSIAKAKAPDGKVYEMAFEWSVKKSENPKGIYVDFHRGFHSRAELEFCLDVDSKETVITFVCKEKGDGIEERVYVYTRGKAFDKARLEQVLKKNNLGHIKVDKTYNNCPPNVEKI